MRVIWTPEAQQDRADIWDYIAADSPRAAVKMEALFSKAAWVFDDPLAVSVQDRIENGEQRWQTIGLVGGCLLLLVAHTVQLGAAEVIRIVSARRADRKERKCYEQG